MKTPILVPCGLYAGDFCDAPSSPVRADADRRSQPAISISRERGSTPPADMLTNAFAPLASLRRPISPPEPVYGGMVEPGWKCVPLARAA